MLNGNSFVVEFGKETTYGTAASPLTHRVQVSSEDMKYSPTKKEEGLLTGLRSKGKSETMGIKTEGKVSTLVRPDFAGLILKCLFGVETAPAEVTGSTKAYKHVFSAIGNAETDLLPSLTVVVDRKAAVLAYIGSTIGSVDFSAEPEDYLKFDVNFVGKDEVAGTLNSALKITLLKAFKFRGASIKIADTAVADVTSIKLSYNNGLDSSVQTTDTGTYYKRPQPGTREIKVDGEMLYTAAGEALRTTWYKTDNETSMEINFESDEFADAENNIKYSLKFIIPCGQFEIPNTTTSDGTSKQSFTFNAIENGTDELITAELVNTQSEEY